MIWYVGGAFVVLVAGLLISARSRGRTVDLGSVSTSWTTEHNAADRGGDRSGG